MRAKTHATHRSAAAVLTGLLTVGLALTGCTNSGSSTAQGSPPPAGSSANDQQVQTPSASASTGSTCTADQYGVDGIDLASTTVGFSQSEATSNPFRATETASIEAEAKKRGIKLLQRNANADVNQQNADIQALIAQGAKVLIVAPENSSGLAPALGRAKSEGIPVLTIDRTVDGDACSDYIGFIGSDFAGQAAIAANDMGQALNGQGQVAVLQGTPGNNVATARTEGFVSTLQQKFPGVSVVANQPANFDQATGQRVTAQILQSNPDLKGIYAESDNMALGAVQAIRAAGKRPGEDIKVVGIDGIREAVQDVVDGLMVSTIETNPRFGPLAFSTIEQFYGSGAPTNVVIADQHFTSANAAEALQNGQVY